MLFNSLSFLLFFPLVCVLYFCIPAGWLRARNVLLLAASYYFYMNWEPAYALLLLTSTAVTYTAALGMDGAARKRTRKACLAAGITLNLAILFLFKYYAFAAANITAVLQWTGMSLHVPEFSLLLPVGISFYTFQAVGYSIDVYRGTQRVERDFLTYALFVSFFPQLVAGPIERSGNLLPQFRTRHTIDYDRMMAGFRMMLWGYFLKLVVADRCGLYVDAVFNNIDKHNGGACLTAALLFPFQIYGDFAGYSLIAIGVARVLGFLLMENFRRPYFACSVGEFWHRWHISLSTWFRDYVYIPLGGNRRGQARSLLNIMATFVASGIWHGANWTFLWWGTLHGALLCVERVLGIGNRHDKGLLRWCRVALTFLTVSALWVLFRAGSIADALMVYTAIIMRPGLPDLTFSMFTEVTLAMAAVALLLTREALKEKGRRVILPPFVSHLAAVMLMAAILLFGVLDGDQFIYFQF